MTPDEMRDQAQRHRAEAAALDGSAEILRSVSGSVSGLLAGVVGMSRLAWQGPAATDFEEQAELQRRHLDEQSHDIADSAAGLVSKAASLRSDAVWLVGEASRIEAEQAADTAGASDWVPSIGL